MRKLPIEFVGGTNRNRSKRTAETKCINLIPEVVHAGGRSTSIFHGVPGTVEKYDFGSSGRGATFFENKIFCVFGEKLYSISDALAFAPVEIGTIPNDGNHVYIGSGNGVVAVGNNTSTLYYTSGVTLNSVSAGSRKTAGGCFIDGKFVFYDPGTNRWWSTESNSSITIDAADTTTAVSQSDNLKGTHNHDQQLLLFGEKTIEIWATASSGDPPFSKRLTIPIGTIAGLSVVSLTNGVCFVGNDRQVYQMQGYTPINISDGIEDFLESATISQIESAFAFTYKQAGHEYYWLTIPGYVTLCYDTATNLWHQRATGVNELNNSATFYVNAWGRHFLGASDGTLVEMDLNEFKENGAVIKQVRSFRLTNEEAVPLFVNKIVIIHDTGTIEDTTEPMMVLRYSKDGKMTWTEKQPVTMGKQGDYKNMSVFHLLGQGDTFDVEIYNTNACRVSLAGAYALVN